MSTSPEQPEGDTPAWAGTTQSRLARVYAEAVMAAALPAGKADELGAELATFVKTVLDTNPGVERYLGSPAVGRKARAAALADALPGRASDLFRNLLSVLNETGRLGLLRGIAAAYQDMIDSRAGRVRVRVTAAAPLDADQTAKLKQTLQTTLHREPVLDVRIDPDILGGLVVRVGDRVTDTSVRTRLASLKSLLMTKGGSHGV